MSGCLKGDASVPTLLNTTPAPTRIEGFVRESDIDERIIICAIVCKKNYMQAVFR